MQITEDSSSIEIIDTFGFESNKCILFTAAPGTISKCDIAKNNMAFFEGEEFVGKLHFYLPEQELDDYLFLLDLEESTAIGAGPGIRIAIDNNGELLVNRNKYLEETLRQNPDNAVKFPIDKWVALELRVLLSQKEEGHIKLYQDDQLIIEATEIQTLPKDFLYIIQGSKSVYQSIQIGITASSSSAGAILYADDIDIFVAE